MASALKLGEFDDKSEIVLVDDNFCLKQNLFYDNTKHFWEQKTLVHKIIL